MTVSRVDRRAGMTLVETTIVLAVVSVIIAAVWMVSSVVYENARQYQANRQMTTIVQNIRQLYMRVNALTVGQVDCTLDNQAAFPIEMRLNQSTACSSGNALLNHPWASQATGSVRVYNRSASTFGIVFTNLPKKACIGLATKLTGGEITGLVAVLINGNTVTPPVTIVTATTSCNVSSDTNSIEWQFNLRS